VGLMGEGVGRGHKRERKGKTAKISSGKKSNPNQNPERKREWGPNNRRMGRCV